MEFKVVLPPYLYFVVKCIGRNRMEFKGVGNLKKSFDKGGIGRNRMEFKVCSWYSSMTCCNGIGRNRMEFKVR